VGVRLLPGDCRTVLATLPSESVHCVVTSPPYYGLRDYGVPGQLGLEATPAEYIASMVAVFREVRRVLRSDGTLWLNMGDSYAGGGGYHPNAPSNLNGSKQSTNHGSVLRDKAPGYKSKDLIGVPWMLAFALRDDGWYLRSDIIWSKPNPMPESVTDRPTKAHEYLFLLSKSARYFYDADAIREGYTESSLSRYEYDFKTYGLDGHPSAAKHGTLRDGGTIAANPVGRNKRSVWEIATEPFPEAHFATYPTALVEPCIKAGSPLGGTVLDPFAGAGTTGLVADRLGRDAILIELNPMYASMAQRRITDDAPMFARVELAVCPT